MHNKTYYRLKKLSLDEVIPNISDDRKNKPTMQVTDKESVKVFSVRLNTFKKGTVCVRCGIKGTHFWAERQHHGNTLKFHLNMYGTNTNGHEVLMTKDHILPKSKGGKNSLDNMQTMCIVCNQYKGNGDIDQGHSSIHCNVPKIKSKKKKIEGWNMKVNDLVSKTSRKKFKSGNRVEQIISLQDFVRGTHAAVFAKMTNCKDLVPFNCLTNLKEEVHLMLERDNT